MNIKMCRFIGIFKIFILKTHKLDFFLARILRFTHSTLLQCIWNIQSFHSWSASVSLLFILSSSFWYFLLHFLLCSHGSFWPNLITYQPPLIAFNNDFRFPFRMGWLESSTLILWNKSSIKWVYKLQCSNKFYSKAFNQQPIKAMVTQTDSSASVV